MVNSKAQLRKTVTDKIVNMNRLNQRNAESYKFKVSGTRSIGSTKTNTNRAVTGTFLPTIGGALQGSVGFPLQKVTVSANTIDISQMQTGRVILNSPASTLNTINGFHYDGEILFLQGTSGVTHTLGTTGNIETLTGSNFSLVNDDTIIVMYDVTDSKWHMITNGRTTVGDNLGNHTATTTLNMSSQRVSGIKDLIFDGTDTGITPTSYEISAISSSSLLVFNVPTSNGYSWYVGASRIFAADNNKFTFDKGVNFKVNTISSTTTITDAYHVIVATNTSGNPQADLPSASGRAGQEYIFYKKNNGGTLILDASGSDLIDGSGTYTLTAQYETVTIVSDGIDRWMITSTG